MLGNFIPIESTVDLITDVWGHWMGRCWKYLNKKDEGQKLMDQLSRADTLEEWQDTAVKIDVEQGHDLWRQNPVDDEYDYKMIASRLRFMLLARRNKDYDKLVDLIRSGTIRNLGSLGSEKLYTHALAGTKLLIEDYINEVIRTLEFLRREKKMSVFFREIKQSFGRTALILHGGSLFGLCHLGVVRALIHARMLPKVISGTTVGAAVAAFVCATPMDSVLEAIDEIPGRLAGSMPSAPNASMMIPVDILWPGFPPELVLFEQHVQDCLGNITFEEAYSISGRVLNITILPKEKGTRLFNYLLTPKVLVRTAVRASMGVVNVQLLAKNYKGGIIPFQDDENTAFIPANVSSYQESSYQRLSELFNVNNYLVSVSRPYLAFLSQGYGQPQLLRRIADLCRLSAQYRMAQLAEWGLLPRTVEVLVVDEIIRGGFQIKIIPEPESVVHDIFTLYDSGDIASKVAYWIKIGERGVWPQQTIIWVRTAIEFCLDGINDEIDVKKGNVSESMVHY